VNNAASIVGLAAVPGLAWKLFVPSASVEGFTISLICLGLIARVVLTTRKERYANASYFREKISRSLAEAQHRLAQNDRTGVDKNVQDALDQLSTVFSLITSTPNRATIKITDGENVFVYARDRASAESNRLSDAERARRKFDTLANNPHIKDLMAMSVDGEDYVIMNNLLKGIREGDYISSSVSWWNENRNSRVWGSDPLPYRSTVMSVIWSPDGNHEALGFLAIDSPSRNVYRHYFDGPLLTSFAWELSNLLQNVARSPAPTTGAN
jgi:hypothetical protein